MIESPPNRCRIVLISPAGETADSFASKFSAAISGGDVASLRAQVTSYLGAKFLRASWLTPKTEVA